MASGHRWEWCSRAQRQIAAPTTEELCLCRSSPTNFLASLLGSFICLLLAASLAESCLTHRTFERSAGAGSIRLRGRVSMSIGQGGTRGGLDSPAPRAGNPNAEPQAADPGRAWGPEQWWQWAAARSGAAACAAAASSPVADGQGPRSDRRGRAAALIGCNALLDN
jgi:hypothetical protein